MIRIVSAVALVASVILSSDLTSSVAQPAPAQAVKERQEIMKSLWPSYYRDMARAVRGENTDLAAMAAKATQASATFKKIALLFPAGSGHDAVPESRAKPEIWTQRADFEAAISTLAGETTAMGEAFKSGNADTIKAQWVKVVQACGTCHGGPTKSGGKFRFEE